MKFTLKDDKKRKTLWLVVPIEASKRKKEFMSDLKNDRTTYFRNMSGYSEPDYVLRMYPKEGCNTVPFYKGWGVKRTSKEKVRIKIEYDNEKQANYYREQIREILRKWDKRTR
jgi:hypothetical protein